MAEIAAELVAVERKLWSGQATIVTAQTTEGEIGVLAGHEPMLGQLIENGVVTIRPADGERLVAAVQGGFISVSKDKVTILADYAEWATEVDTAAAEALAAGDNDHDVARGQAQLRAVRRSNEA